MKAVQYERFGGPEVLRYLDLPDPRPGQGELLIETAAIGVNFPDIRERLGVYNKAETRVGGVQLPQVGGIAVAGTVVEAGPDTGAGLVGRRVVALMKKGAYAELAVAAEALCAVGRRRRRLHRARRVRSPGCVRPSVAPSLDHLATW